MNYCLYEIHSTMVIFVGITDPSADCVILSNETEVIVSPKLRKDIIGHKVSQPEEKSQSGSRIQKPDHFPDHELDECKLPYYPENDDDMDSSTGSISRKSSDKISPSKWNWKDWIPWLLGTQQTTENNQQLIPDTGQGVVRSGRRLSIDKSQESLVEGTNFTFRVQSLMATFDAKS